MRKVAEMVFLRPTTREVSSRGTESKTEHRKHVHEAAWDATCMEGQPHSALDQSGIVFVVMSSRDRLPFTYCCSLGEKPQLHIVYHCATEYREPIRKVELSYSKLQREGLPQQNFCSLETRPTTAVRIISDFIATHTDAAWSVLHGESRREWEREDHSEMLLTAYLR